MLVFTSDIHGEWFTLYESLPEGTRAVFICGDAQALRNDEDMEITPAPAKYLQPGDFFYFYDEGAVPVPTYMMLGNHEPFAYLHPYEQKGPSELIKNLWVLRRSGVIEIEGWVIAYLSRVFSYETYRANRLWDPEKVSSLKSKEAGRFIKDDVDYLFRAVKQTQRRIQILALHENPNYAPPEGQEVYRKIVRTLHPDVIICGHRHEKLRETFGGVPLIGLARAEILPFTEETIQRLFPS